MLRLLRGRDCITEVPTQCAPAGWSNSVNSGRPRAAASCSRSRSSMPSVVFTPGSQITAASACMMTYCRLKSCTTSEAFDDGRDISERRSCFNDCAAAIQPGPAYIGIKAQATVSHLDNGERQHR